MNSIINFITGKKTAWATLLIGLVFAVLAFGPLRAATTELNPGVGLPDDAESVIAAKLAEDLPGADSTAAVIVYAAESAMSDEQKVWVQGAFDPMKQMVVGGANEKLIEFTNLEVEGP